MVRLLDQYKASARKGLRRCTAISRLEPAIFTIFCSHSITISLFGGIAFFTGLHETDGIYPLFFLLQLVACIALGILLKPLLSWIPCVTGGARSNVRNGGPAAGRFSLN